MASLAQSILSSGVVGFFLIFVLFVLFLVPFDRRFIERYIMQIGAEPVAPAPLMGGTRPYTRQLCKMLDLKVVSFARRKFFVRSRRLELAVGRWNEEAREFEVVTQWCKTWEDLEEEARQAIKSFQGIASPKYRGASNV